jgi:hypothetical protein
VAILHGPYELHIVSASNKEDKTKKVLKLSNSLEIRSIFSSMEEDVMIFTTEKFIAQYDLKNSKILGQQTIEGLDVSSLVYGFNKIAVISGNSIYVTNARL